ncbi:endolytic transglycosylase MltG [Flexivirga sp. B27]
MDSSQDETTEFVAASVGREPASDDGEWTGFHDWTPVEDDQIDGQRVSYEELQRHRRRRAGRSCLLLVVLMVVALAGAGYAASKVGRVSLPGMKQTDPDYKGKGSGSVTIVVKEGDSGAAIAQALLKAGVVKSTGAFVQAAGASRDFGSIQPGSYTLHKKMSAQAALAMMLDPKSFKSNGITIPEGLWAQEVFKLLSKRTGVPLADYQKVTAASVGLPAAAKGHLEGYLFPSTYNFGKDSTAQQQLTKMVSEWRKKVEPLHIPENKLHDVMVRASLVEAESRLTSDGPKVSRVIENRVEQGMPLQLDSTIHYAEKQRGTITTTDKQRNKEGPYNSYLNTGMPPTPINSPGLAAIKSALHPADGKWLYFVTVDPQTGKTLFADTYEEQQKNEKAFHSWCKQHSGKC